MRTHSSMLSVACIALAATASLVTSQPLLAAPATQTAATGSSRLVPPEPIRQPTSQPGTGDGTLRISPAPASTQNVVRPVTSQPGSGDGTLRRTPAAPVSMPSQTSK